MLCSGVVFDGSAVVFRDSVLFVVVVVFNGSMVVFGRTVLSLVVVVVVFNVSGVVFGITVLFVSVGLKGTCVEVGNTVLFVPCVVLCGSVDAFGNTVVVVSINVVFDDVTRVVIVVFDVEFSFEVVDIDTVELIVLSPRCVVVPLGLILDVDLFSNEVDFSEETTGDVETCFITVVVVIDVNKDVVVFVPFALPVTFEFVMVVVVRRGVTVVEALVVFVAFSLPVTFEIVAVVVITRGVIVVEAIVVFFPVAVPVTFECVTVGEVTRDVIVVKVVVVFVLFSVPVTFE